MPDQALELPSRLPAPDPGWEVVAGVVVVGSGIAGLTTALRARETTGGRVLLVTKTYLHPGDSPEEHLQDTLVAGVGLCDETVVRVLVEEGPARVRELIAVAVALRAAVEVTDLEFVQFHPTVLWLGASSSGQQPLVSEAVRGEGATLVDDDGVPFMAGQHELADLAPRDVVAKAIMTRMRETGASHMWLDARELGEEEWHVRLPTILASCREHGIDPVTELIPVAPACHYASGGVRTDLDGRTRVPGLYACGEVACTGVHGANRLASNSLLEGLVFGHRIAEHLGRGLVRQTPPAGAAKAGLLNAALRADLQQAMSRGAGVLRSRASLAQVCDALATMSSRASDVPCTEDWEATNLHLVATVLADVAARREETRGSHWRADFPDRDDDRWRRHLVSTVENGTVTTRVEALCS